MDMETFIGGTFSLLFLGHLVMSPVPREWHTAGVWQLVSLIGKPLFSMAITIAVKVPILLFGAVACACFHAGGSSQWRQ